MPAIFQLVHGRRPARSRSAERVNFRGDLEHLSFAVAIVLLLTYVAGLLFSLQDAPRPLQPRRTTARSERGRARGRCASAVIMLAIAGVAVGVMSEILVGSITEASEAIGLSPFFVGLIVVAIVGNAAEHWVAVYFATRDKMDLAVNIAIGSSAQIALFVAPVLVLLSFVVGPYPDGARLQRLRARRRSSSRS